MVNIKTLYKLCSSTLIIFIILMTISLVVKDLRLNSYSCIGSCIAVCIFYFMMTMFKIDKKDLQKTLKEGQKVPS